MSDSPSLFTASLIEIKKQVDGLREAALQRFLTQARKAVGLSGDVSLLLTSNREMRALNRNFRGKDKPTDVLSFPAVDAVAARFAGDLAISVDIAAVNARDLRHTVENEVRILILHGLLHLAGYDHEADAGQMARKESRLRNALGLPSTLIERSIGKPAVSKKAKIRSSIRKRRAR